MYVTRETKNHSDFLLVYLYLFIPRFLNQVKGTTMNENVSLPLQGKKKRLEM